MTDQKPLKFAMATDGSERAEIALKLMVTEFLGPKDEATVFSVTDKYKTNLLDRYQPDYIMTTTKNFLLSHVA